MAPNGRSSQMTMCRSFGTFWAARPWPSICSLFQGWKQDLFILSVLNCLSLTHLQRPEGKSLSITQCNNTRIDKQSRCKREWRLRQHWFAEIVRVSKSKSFSLLWPILLIQHEIIDPITDLAIAVEAAAEAADVNGKREPRETDIAWSNFTLQVSGSSSRVPWILI